MTGVGYVSATDFIAGHRELGLALLSIMSWRTEQWSDRVIAAAVLLVQRNWSAWSRPRRGYASLRIISQALGYRDRTPLVQRALKRLLARGWLRVIGPGGRGRHRVFQFWAGALIGMVSVGMLTFIVFRMSVMIFTALQGAVMIVSGALALLMLHAGMGGRIRPELIANRFLVYIIVGVPAVVGFAYQHAIESGKIRKKRAASEKPPA